MDWPHVRRATDNALVATLHMRPGSIAVVGRAVDDVARTAMGLLRRAVVEGYRNANTMAKEPALDPLRGRPEFRLIVMDLAFPFEPFARRETPPSNPERLPRILHGSELSCFWSRAWICNPGE
jgi:hypothetical protein